MSSVDIRPLSMTGSEPAGFKGLLGWTMFDWANQPFFTVITTFIFAPYFAAEMIADPVQGQAYWGYIQATAGFLIAILSPVFGAMADAGGPRKPWIGTFQALTVIGCILLWWALPDASGSLVLLIAFAMVIATVGAEFSVVFNNAMLPSLVTAERIGRMSGIGWGMGYLGGLVALVLVAIVLPDSGLFDKEAHEHNRMVGPFSALWLIVFVLPMFLYTPDRESRRIPLTTAARDGLAQLGATLRELRRYRNIVRYLIARMLYNDGILAVIGFSGIYAKGVFGWSTFELGLFGIIITAIAIVGCLIGGWLDDRLGSKRTIQMAVILLTVATLGVISIGRDSVLFGIPMPAGEASGFLQTPAQIVFMLFGLLMGLGFGPAQAASRTMMARMAPPDLMTEFFGLFALSGKATAFLAPFLIGLVTQSYDSQRAGLVVVIAFFVLGYFLLLPVREQQEKPDG